MAGLREADKITGRLAEECAKSFAESSGLGCSVADESGGSAVEFGYGCSACKLCRAMDIPPDACSTTHRYGMAEAERFGGKYIYFCPMGLTFFVSPILGTGGGYARITVGPLLMVEPEDYVAADLEGRLHLDARQIAAAQTLLPEIPAVTPRRVQALSTLLFLAVGFLNNAADAGNQLETQDTDAIQGQISAYILELKQGAEAPRYPLDKERALMGCIARAERARAQQLLNEILGHILISSGIHMEQMKVRVYELLVQISRAAVLSGVSQEDAFRINCQFFREAQTISDMDRLCFLITNVLGQLTDCVFQFADVKHVDVISKAVQYIRENYMKKITLADAAHAVYLSPSYFCKVFKREMGCNFSSFLNRVRVDKSKKLLLEGVRVTDVATLVGFEDQSYYTKVFKKFTGQSPIRFRDTGGRETI